MVDADSKEPAFAEIVAAARAAWPEVVFDDGAFTAFLRARAARAMAASIKNAGDLLLAFACARGDAVALRIVEREYLGEPEALLPKRHQHEAAEIVQLLRERVLVSEGSAPARIEAYTGRGPLQAWLRVAAVRVALNLQRKSRREVPLDEDGSLAERAGQDLELVDLKRRYEREFRAAFSAGLRALAPRDRLLLRQHYIDGLGMAAIAGVHRVHRITIVRWMETARTALARETRRELGTRLRVDRRELESILRLVESRMDMSIQAFLTRS